MAVETNPFAIQALNYSAEITRRAIASLLKRGATVGSVTGGVVASTDMAVTAGPSMHVTVAPGEGWIAGSTSATQSGYYARASSSSELAIAAADPTNPRVDRIVAVVKDAAYSGAENSFSLAVVTGTPTAAATLANRETHGYPAAPASSLTLAAVLVPAKAASIVAEDVENVAPLLDLGLTLSAGVVGTSQLAALAVTTAKLAEGAVTDAKVATGRALVETGNAYGALTVRTSGTEYEPSATRLTFVSLFAECLEGNEKTISLNVSVDGTQIAYQRGSSSGGTPSGIVSYSFLCPPKLKWVAILTTTSGASELKSSYLVL